MGSQPTLDLYFDSTDVGLVDTDSHGAFGMALKAPTIRQNGFTIQIPKDAVPGQHWITAVERITQLQAQVPFTVRTDWPQFHYAPDHTGFNPYETILSPNTVGSLAVKWQAASNFYSSPSVANGTVYIAGDNGNGSALYALTATTGAVLWTHALHDTWRSAPAVANGVVYVRSGSYAPLYALNASTGTVLWKYPLPGVYVSSPAVANGVVYVSDGNDNLCALNASTGVLLWQFNTGDVASPPAVANGIVYVGGGGNLYALNASTGTLLWKNTIPDFGQAPTVANGVVYATSGQQGAGLYALNANTGELLWQYEIAAYTTPAVANGVVYVEDFFSTTHALNASTGALVWKSEVGGYYNSYSSPAVANGVVYVGTEEDQNIYALNAATGELLWKYTADDYVDSSPAVVNGIVYVGFYAFGLPNQQMSEKFSPPERPDPARLTPDWSLQPGSQVTPPLKK